MYLLYRNWSFLVGTVSCALEGMPLSDWVFGKRGGQGACRPWALRPRMLGERKGHDTHECLYCLKKDTHKKDSQFAETATYI